MNLVPIIYTTLLILVFVSFIVLVGSYVVFKMKQNKRKEEFEKREPKPIYYTYVETEPRITTSVYSSENKGSNQKLPQLDYSAAIKNSFVKNSSVYYPNLNR